MAKGILPETSMALSNNSTSYGSVTRSFHWLTALLILTLIPVAIIAEELPFDTSEQLARKAWLFSLHKTLGVSVFFVALLRIFWAITQPKPASLHPNRKLEKFAAETAHWLLYGSLVLAPLSGWIHHAATSGFAPIWWPLGQNLPLVPKSETFAAFAGGLHWVFGKVMIASILLHITGALKHQFIDKDATLRRMITGTSVLAPLPAPQHSKTPLAAAVGIWAAALAIGNFIGVFTPHGNGGVQAAQLQAVASEWTVQDGSIGIAITQFGSTVEGRFTDWTADISFDPDVMTGPSGAVDVTISIGSLRLGSVTDQALAPDFFNVQEYETATFKADLVTDVDGFMANGTLTIKGESTPINMPFRLSTTGQDANVQAQLTLDRRTFGIGDNMADESSLAFAVDVKIALNATRD